MIVAILGGEEWNLDVATSGYTYIFHWHSKKFGELEVPNWGAILDNHVKCPKCGKRAPDNYLAMRAFVMM